MASFTVRVILHDVEDDEAELYEKLHEEMAARGFSRTIVGSDGIEYELPPAEYRFSGGETGQQVRTLARAAAQSTGKKNGVLVSEAATCWWIDLDRAPKSTFKQRLEEAHRRSRL